MKLFYFSRLGNKLEGPVPADQLYQMVNRGELYGSTMVRDAAQKDCAENWSTFDSLPAKVFSRQIQKEIKKGERLQRDIENAEEGFRRAGIGCAILILSILGFAAGMVIHRLFLQ